MMDKNEQYERARASAPDKIPTREPSSGELTLARRYSADEIHDEIRWSFGVSAVFGLTGLWLISIGVGAVVHVLFKLGSTKGWTLFLLFLPYLLIKAVVLFFVKVYMPYNERQNELQGELEQMARRQGSFFTPKQVHRFQRRFLMNIVTTMMVPGTTLIAGYWLLGHLCLFINMLLYQWFSS